MSEKDIKMINVVVDSEQGFVSSIIADCNGNKSYSAIIDGQEFIIPQVPANLFKTMRCLSRTLASNKYYYAMSTPDGAMWRYIDGCMGVIGLMVEHNDRYYYGETGFCAPPYEGSGKTVAAQLPSWRQYCATWLRACWYIRCALPFGNGDYENDIARSMKALAEAFLRLNNGWGDGKNFSAAAKKPNGSNNEISEYDQDKMEVILNVPEIFKRDIINHLQPGELDKLVCFTRLEELRKNPICLRALEHETMQKAKGFREHMDYHMGVVIC